MFKRRKNIHRLGEKLWFVTSQAGFRKVVKHVLNEEGFDDTRNYPTCYPSIVTYELCYFGYRLAMFHCTPVNAYKEHLQARLNLIERIDKTNSIKDK